MNTNENNTVAAVGSIRREIEQNKTKLSQAVIEFHSKCSVNTPYHTAAHRTTQHCTTQQRTTSCVSIQVQLGPTDTVV